MLKAFFWQGSWRSNWSSYQTLKIWNCPVDEGKIIVQPELGSTYSLFVLYIYPVGISHRLPAPLCTQEIRYAAFPSFNSKAHRQTSRNRPATIIPRSSSVLKQVFPGETTIIRKTQKQTSGNRSLEYIGSSHLGNSRSRYIDFCFLICNSTISLKQQGFEAEAYGQRCFTACSENYSVGSTFEWR